MSAAPTVHVLKVADLFVDHTVQRPLDPARANSIMRTFRDDALGVIVVSRRGNGQHHIIDGQHRVAAIRESGLADYEVSCLVYVGLSRADEAAMFRHLNNTKKPAILDRFRVRVVEGDAVAVRLAAMLRRHGWEIAAGASPGSYAAVSALETLYADSDLATCDRLIAIVTEAWGHDPNGVRAEIVAGLGAVLVRHPEATGAKLVNELAKYEGGPRALVGRAKGLRELRRGRVLDAMADIVIELHNRRRSSNRLPAWQAS